MTAPLHPHLFTPVQIGPITLKHRVVMAPLTRSRSEQPGDIPGRLMLEYYAQRLYSDRQVEGWKKITAAVHAKGGRMFSQLWHTGSSSRVEMAGGQMPVSASVNPSYWAAASHHAAGYALRGSHRLLGRASLEVYVVPPSIGPQSAGSGSLETA
jgi:N-ethylmaleimide reductase